MQNHLPNHEIVPHHFEEESVVFIRLTGKHKETREEILDHVKTAIHALMGDEYHGHRWGYFPAFNPVENRIEVTFAHMDRILNRTRRPGQ